MSDTQLTAAFITPECRANRGVDGAWEEAVSRLRTEYEAVVAAWASEPVEPTLNLRLTMERPRSGKPSDVIGKIGGSENRPVAA